MSSLRLESNCTRSALAGINARMLSRCRRVILVAGHYEGFDERIRQALADVEISLGDFVLSGGEIPAMAVVDAVVRLLPGAVGEPRSLNEESFSMGLLEYPQYTRPREFRGLSVPEVLTSGDHAKIAAWQAEQAAERTRQRRPDLWQKHLQQQTAPASPARDDAATGVRTDGDRAGDES